MRRLQLRFGNAKVEAPMPSLSPFPPSSTPTQALHWLDTTLAVFGLQQRGHFWVGEEDGMAASPPLPRGLLVLVGNIGSTFWPHFESSPEAQDGQAHPLDRWSQGIGDTLAAQCKGQAFYPFGGPPHYSFLRWAAKAESLGASPLGLRIHPVHGLWHAYRFALLIPVDMGREATLHRPSTEINPSDLSDICVQCSTKACLKACPVNAFTPEGYDVARCASYLHTALDQGQDQISACVSHTCQARSACPVGVQYQYTEPHGQFHMRQFMRAHRSLNLPNFEP